MTIGQRCNCCAWLVAALTFCPGASWGFEGAANYRIEVTPVQSALVSFTMVGDSSQEFEEGRLGFSAEVFLADRKEFGGILMTLSNAALLRGFHGAALQSSSLLLHLDLSELGSARSLEILDGDSGAVLLRSQNLRVRIDELASIATVATDDFMATHELADLLGDNELTGQTLFGAVVDMDPFWESADGMRIIDELHVAESEDFSGFTRESADDDQSGFAIAGSSSGPDVTVLDLTGTANYGTLDGISAFAIATTSCNSGDQNLRWDRHTNRHPVIAQNVYRLRSGRFEQIGMSWLKHGFYSTNSMDVGCAPCSNPNTAELLGVGCSDLYSAGLNGEQRNLGPRSQVNPHTGIFPFPFRPLPTPWTILTGRIQISNNDLHPDLNPQSRYFIEGQYVTADDSAAGHQNNNASHREALVNPNPSLAGAYIISRTGTVVRRESAIRAWKRLDPTVVETDVQLLGEGLFVVSTKATELPNGYWDYEYAIHNLNSHRAAREFSLPLPNDAVVVNVGFHDVHYHSSEPYSGEDWAVEVASGSIRWSTGSDENANALRWGTLYNFRFQSNAEPGETTALLGLYRGGLPSEVALLTQGPKLDLIDCNDTSLADRCDISCGEIGGDCYVAKCGLSRDINENQVPDECEADCNHNTRPDDFDIRNGFSMDCLPNGVPDECEDDCDEDGIPDACDGSDADLDGIIDCDDLCPLTTPPNVCLCPPTGLCCFSTICLEDYPQQQCAKDGGRPECLGSPCNSGCLPGDADGDGVLQLFDVFVLQRCFSGATVTPGFVTPSEACRFTFDNEDDLDIDYKDYQKFERDFAAR